MAGMDFKPGQRVRVRQIIDRREGNWSGETVGEIVEIMDEPTGSWFAHGKDDKLWLRRIRLKKESGELTTLTLDRFSDVQVL